METKSVLCHVLMDADVHSSLTNRGEVCCHEISSLWHDGLQTHTLQQRGQFVLLVVQHGRQLLEVALWSPKHLILSLKPTSHSFLLKFRMQRRISYIQTAPLIHFLEYLEQNLWAKSENTKCTAIIPLCAVCGGT